MENLNTLNAMNTLNTLDSLDTFDTLDRQLIEKSKHNHETMKRKKFRHKTFLRVGNLSESWSWLEIPSRILESC